MLERSEPSLYAIEQELSNCSTNESKLVSVLGSAGDAPLVNRLLNQYSVEVIFHAAAYKHVPMVEANPLAALANNTIATYVLASAAISAGVESFSLISTDKTVRPTNVMGATKRCARACDSGTCSNFSGYTIVYGSLWQCARLFRICCPVVSSPDCLVVRSTSPTQK